MSSPIIGVNTVIHPSARLEGKNIRIGDGCYVGANVQILVDDFVLGDYCKIHNNATLHGYKPLRIGHNAWIGQGTIIDCIGGTTIGNNCGIGAYSQLWSHIRYGDPLEGCNYESNKALTIGNDVWLVGHCITSPVNIADKAMALVGSVVTHDLEYNRIYGGSPAKDLTDKIAPQFREVTIEHRRSVMKQFSIPDSVRLIEDDNEIDCVDFSYFNIVTRQYTKRGTSEEFEFMKALQKKLVKFTPYDH